MVLRETLGVVVANKVRVRVWGFKGGGGKRGLVGGLKKGVLPSWGLVDGSVQGAEFVIKGQVRMRRESFEGLSKAVRGDTLKYRGYTYMFFCNI
jgi:hypothetical protein